MVNKYSKALDLFYACIGENANVNEQFDLLLEYLQANFDTPKFTQENIAECYSVLKKQVPVEDILCDMPKVSDVVYPIALTKIVLTEYQLPINAAKSKQFETFHIRYGRLIFESMMSYS